MEAYKNNVAIVTELQPRLVREIAYVVKVRIYDLSDLAIVLQPQPIIIFKLPV